VSERAPSPRRGAAAPGPRCLPLPDAQGYRRVLRVHRRVRNARLESQAQRLSNSTSARAHAGTFPGRLQEPRLRTPTPLLLQKNASQSSNQLVGQATEGTKPSSACTRTGDGLRKLGKGNWGGCWCKHNPGQIRPERRVMESCKDGQHQPSADTGYVSGCRQQQATVRAAARVQLIRGASGGWLQARAGTQLQPPHRLPSHPKPATLQQLKLSTRCSKVFLHIVLALGTFLSFLP